MKSFIKDVFSVSMSNAAIIIFGLAKTIIIARWLGPENNGIIAALLVYPSLFITIGSLGIRQVITFFIGKNTFPEKNIKIAVFQIWVFTTLICLFSSFFLIKYFSNVAENSFLIILAIIPIPFDLFNTYNSGFFLGKNKIKEFNSINWLPSVFVFLASLVLIIIFDMGIVGAMVSFAIGPILMSIILILRYRLLAYFQLKFDFTIIKALISLGGIYALALLIISLNYKIDLVILDKLSTPYELGIYSKGASLTEYLWLLPMLLSTIIFARSSIATNGVEFSKKVVKLLRVSILLIASAALILAAFARQIILILYGNLFEDSTEVLQFLLPGVLLLTIFKVLNMDIAGKGKPWISVYAMLPGLILNIVLNLYLIPKYGANGAALASSASYSLAAIIFLIKYSSIVQIPVIDIFRFSIKDFEFVTIIVKEFNKRKR